MMRFVPKSSVANILWPALPARNAANILSVIYQLRQSQWWDVDVLQTHQLRQLRSLLKHAYETVPFYHDRLIKLGYTPGQEISLDFWAQLPLLQRSAIQDERTRLLSRKTPESHGPITEIRTSGSSGQPIRTAGTAVTSFFWQVFTLRDHLWHQRDMNGKFAAIRAEGTREIPPEGKNFPNWGAPVSLLTDSGPGAILGIQTSIPKQAQWLVAQNPDYLLSHPTNIYELARHSIQTGQMLSKLKEIRTFGETLEPKVRNACRQAWNVPVVDMYSTQEVGYIALQCPEYEHYHIQSENLYVEILDDANKLCKAGDIGRVVVTTLHNYAMPLIRYEIRDYAEVGEKCPCGRGLPVIKQILGRQRNMITLPNGERHWPRFPARMWEDIAPAIRQVQLIQRDLHNIEARLVAKRQLTPDEENQCKTVVTERFGYPFALTFTYFDEIPRTTNAKYEDFISEVAT